MIQAVEGLVSRGHPFRSIVWEYTMDQVDAMADAARRNLTEEAAARELGMAMAMRAAFHANKNQWDKYVSSCQKVIESNRPKAPAKVMSKEQAKQLQALLSSGKKKQSGRK